jgi:HAD superfamily hydrolase (TIGR01509 family)
MARLKGIFFDLDDTLIGSTVAMSAALQAIVPLLSGVSLGRLAQALKESYHALWGYGTPGYLRLTTLPTVALRQELTTAALGSLGITDPSIVEKVLQEYRQAESKALQLLPGASALLQALKPHFRLGVLTNGPSLIQREKLAQVGLFEYFDTIIADSDLGVPKPDTRLFRYAESRIGLSQNELMFVGDSLENDIEGANAAGWLSVSLGPTACPRAHFSIPNLEALVTLSPLCEGKGLAFKEKVADTRD